MLTTYVPFAAITVASHTVGWDFAWPYGANHTCRCEEVPALGFFYESNEACLEAYSKHKYQWCTYNGHSVDDSQCDAAVGIAEGVLNEDCGEKCTGIVAGSVTLDQFEEDCKFNFYADWDEEVSVGWSNCYSNYVYGWSDYNPNNPVQAAPIRVFQNVENPTACQSLCQAVDQCAYWTWRAYPDFPDMQTSFQNPPLTCLLYDQEYIDGVLNTPVPTDQLTAQPTPYCNTDAIPECLVDPFGRDYVDFLEPYSCLLCDCVSKCAWKSPFHLSGPAFCLPEYRDECAYKRPSWTSTLPPCESVDVTTTTTLSMEETSTTTNIEMDETTTETSPAFTTMGTSTTTMSGASTIDTDIEDTMPEEAVTPVGTGEATQPDGPVTPVGSGEATHPDALVTPVGSGEATHPDAPVTPVGSDEATHPDALVTPVGSGEATHPDALVTPVGSGEATHPDALVTPVGSGEVTSPGEGDSDESTTEMAIMPSMTVGTSTTPSATMDITSPTMATNTMGTATTVPGVACPDCDICEDDNCEEPIFIDVDEPCDECLEG